MSGIIHKGRQMMEQARFQKTVTELTQYAQNLGNIADRLTSGSATNEEAWRYVQPLYQAKNATFQNNPKLGCGLALGLEKKHQKMYLMAGTASLANDPVTGFTSAQALMCQEQLPQHVDIINSEGQTTNALDAQQGYALRVEL